MYRRNMKTLFIHLSDLHLFTEPISSNAFAGITRCVQEDAKNCDRLFIVFSGDMSQNGSRKFLTAFESLMDVFAEGLFEKCGKKPEVIVVPGNHDIALPDPDRDSYPLCGEETKKEVDEKLWQSLSSMDPALASCRRFGCFQDDPFFSTRIFDFEGISYRFVLLNSAPFSWRGKLKIDKGHHFLPSTVLPLRPNELEYGKRTVEILVSHHRHDWFDENESQPALRDYIDRHASIVFTGHDHRPSAFQTFASRNVFCSEGGVLKLSGGKIRGSFQTVLLNEDTGALEGKRYLCDDGYDTFALDESQQFDEEISFSEPFPLKKGIRQEFFRSPLRGGEGTLLDFFVAPDLYSDAKDEEISGLDSIVSRLRKDKRMFLLGSAKSGKTSLLRILFLEMRAFGVTLYVDLGNGGMSGVSPKVAERNSFELLYGSEERTRKEFDALPPEERIVFLDNFSLLEEESKKKEWLEYFNERYGIAVFSLASSYNPRERIIEDTFIDPEHRYHIMGLTAKKREMLARKVGNAKGVDPQNYINLFNAAELALRSSSLLDYTDPEDLILVLEEIADKKLYIERNTNNAFNEIFTYSIDQSLVAASSIERLEDLKIVASRLAYSVVERDSSMDVSEKDIFLATDYCVEHFDNIKLDADKTRQYLCKAGILYKRSDGTYRFRRNAFLSYFAAMEYRRLMEDGETEPVNNLLSNACKSLNGDILLFLCFITKNKRLFKRIEEELNKEFETFAPLSLEKKNNWLLNGDTALLPAPKGKTHEEAVANLDSAEQEKLPSAAEAEEQAFSHDPQDHVYKIEKGFKLTEILFKAVSGFKGTFDKSQRERFLKTAIDAERSMLQYVFQFSESDLKLSEESFERYKEQQLDRHKEWSPEKRLVFKKLELSDYLRTLLFDMVFLSEFAFSSLVASSITLPLISSLEGSGFQNRIFKLGAYLHVDNTDRFISELEDTVKCFDKDWQRNIIRRIALLYITVNGPNYRIQTKINDVAVLGTSDKRRRGMLKARNSHFRNGKQAPKKEG